jgi:tetratricopeptide (TPR) repeat protein
VKEGQGPEAPERFVPGRRIFITIPEKLQSRLEGYRTGDFTFDPAVPLPVEAPEADFDPLTLTVEMILSGLLLELADHPSGESSGYYRRFAAALRPHLAAELTDAALVKAQDGGFDTALEIFRLLEGLCPADPGILLNRALVLERRAGRAGAQAAEKDESGGAWEKALAFPMPLTFFHAALFYEKRGDFSRAANCLSAYLERIEEAEETEEAGETDSGDEGDKGEEGDKGDEGEDHAVRARALLNEIRQSGLDDEAFTSAAALIRQGEEEQGILKAREFLERRSGAARGWFVLGWGLRRLSRWDDGAACFEKALELGCVNADVLNELAICLMESGKLPEARRRLERALRLDPDNVTVISNMGILAIKEGDEDRAASFFRTVLELDSEDPVARAFFG